jgi:hypothetical protein
MKGKAREADFDVANQRCAIKLTTISDLISRRKHNICSTTNIREPGNGFARVQEEREKCGGGQSWNSDAFGLLLTPNAFVFSAGCLRIIALLLMDNRHLCLVSDVSDVHSNAQLGAQLSAQQISYLSSAGLPYCRDTATGHVRDDAGRR